MTVVAAVRRGGMRALSAPRGVSLLLAVLEWGMLFGVVCSPFGTEPWGNAGLV